MNIRDVLAEALLDKPEAMDDDLVLSDHENWDSLAQLSIVTGIEDVFGVVISGSELKSVGTVGELSALIESKT